ncbi:uncharacterized protein LOC134531369 [Bacillus rossius redtenbacheri]|uniref:uncharacterized protein LOC134531369 n=1 Tax=Bacillus rossius redtenbacheri TaxID=93214 RepID=UPI002FDD4FB7
MLRNCAASHAAAVMSQPPRSWGRASPLPFRPGSPLYAPSPPPIAARRPAASPSPGPGGRRLGSPYLPCPRPRWASPPPPGVPLPPGPRPYRLPPQSASPGPCFSPDMFFYPPYEAQYVGVPLEPPGHVTDDEDQSGLSTADIIASQSQDYVDEKLAEYQATILQLQGEPRPPPTLARVGRERWFWNTLRFLPFNPLFLHSNVIFSSSLNFVLLSGS